jgi:hypothetical protein
MLYVTARLQKFELMKAKAKVSLSKTTLAS